MRTRPLSALVDVVRDRILNHDDNGKVEAARPGEPGAGRGYAV